MPRRPGFNRQRQCSLYYRALWIEKTEGAVRQRTAGFAQRFEHVEVVPAGHSEHAFAWWRPGFRQALALPVEFVRLRTTHRQNDAARAWRRRIKRAHRVQSGCIPAHCAEKRRVQQRLQIVDAADPDESMHTWMRKILRG